MPSAAHDRSDGLPQLPIPTVSVDLEACCYGPLADRLAPADLAGSERPQRWSDAGAPTVYLASDVGVALAEWGRHVPLDERREPSGLWRVPVRLDRAVDLRAASPGAIVALAGLAGIDPPPDASDPAWCLATDVTRDIGAWLRYAARLDGLLVPSVAFLDDRSRGNIVVFTHEPSDVRARLGTPVLLAAVEWRDRSPDTEDLDTRVQVRARPVLGRV